MRFSGLEEDACCQCEHCADPFVVFVGISISIFSGSGNINSSSVVTKAVHIRVERSCRVAFSFTAVVANCTTARTAGIFVIVFSPVEVIRASSLYCIH